MADDARMPGVYRHISEARWGLDKIREIRLCILRAGTEQYYADDLQRDFRQLARGLY